MTRPYPRRQPPQSVCADGYRVCARAACAKVIPDEASDNQVFCSPYCRDRSQRERGQDLRRAQNA